jgi:hypothetical protein
VDGDGEEDSGEGVYEKGRDKEERWGLSLCSSFLFVLCPFPFPCGLTGWAWDILFFYGKRKALVSWAGFIWAS